MLRLLMPFAVSMVLVTVASTMAEAACFAEYKAKQDDPLKLHYGVISLPDQACANPKALRRAVQQRIAADGWTVLTVMSTFDETGLEMRRQNAGEFFLRY